MADPSGHVALLWDPAVLGYDFGPGHPFAPVRLELTLELIRRTGLLGGSVEEVAPRAADANVLTRVHTPAYLDTVRRLSEDPTGDAGAAAVRAGLGPGDTPAFAGMHPAALAICSASLEAARRVWDGSSIHAFNPAGGLHHAMPDRAAGFCVYNDAALAIDWLLTQGARRVAYVDVDVHHGDGVEAAFRNDPRVLTVSLHESGRYLFPGTGEVSELGGPGAEGSVVNLPLQPGTDGPVWLELFDAAVVPVLRAFAPDVLVTQLGCDTHVTDPLGHLRLTVDDMAATYDRLHRLAHELCDGRWVATGGGGYQLVDVVPRAWTLAFAEMSGRRLPVEIPMAWQETAVALTGMTPPRSFTDDPVEQNEERSAMVRRAAQETLAAVRSLVLPYYGLGEATR